MSITIQQFANGSGSAEYLAAAKTALEGLDIFDSVVAQASGSSGAILTAYIGETPVMKWLNASSYTAPYQNSILQLYDTAGTSLYNDNRSTQFTGRSYIASTSNGVWMFFVSSSLDLVRALRFVNGVPGVVTDYRPCGASIFTGSYSFNGGSLLNLPDRTDTSQYFASTVAIPRLETQGIEFWPHMYQIVDRQTTMPTIIQAAITAPYKATIDDTVVLTDGEFILMD